MTDLHKRKKKLTRNKQYVACEKKNWPSKHFTYFQSTTKWQTIVLHFNNTYVNKSFGNVGQTKRKADLSPIQITVGGWTCQLHSWKNYRKSVGNNNKKGWWAWVAVLRQQTCSWSWSHSLWPCQHVTGIQWSLSAGRPISLYKHA